MSQRLIKKGASNRRCDIDKATLLRVLKIESLGLSIVRISVIAISFEKHLLLYSHIHIGDYISQICDCALSDVVVYPKLL